MKVLNERGDQCRILSLAKLQLRKSAALLVLVGSTNCALDNGRERGERNSSVDNILNIRIRPVFLSNTNLEISGDALENRIGVFYMRFAAGGRDRSLNAFLVLCQRTAENMDMSFKLGSNHCGKSFR